MTYTSEETRKQKLSSIVNKLSFSDKPKIVDYIIWSAVAVFCFFTFLHGDITQTGRHGYQLLKDTVNGEFFNFYSHVIDIGMGGAVYNIFIYIIFAIWTIPMGIFRLLSGAEAPDFVMNMWLKSLPLVLHLSSAYIMYLIGNAMNFAKDKSKWMAVFWILNPIAFFSTFIFGQYDTINLFFTLLGILFLLKKKYYKFSIIMGIAIVCKIFSLFIFIPIVLLFEKRIIHIAKFVAIAFWLQLLTKLLFIGRPGIAESNPFMDIMTDRLVSSGISGGLGTIALFPLCMIGICIYAYLKKVDSEEELVSNIFYICLFAFGVFFMFVGWHPQWVILITPYIVITTFREKHKTVYWYIDILMGISFILCTVLWYVNGVDQVLINLGILPKLFGYGIDDVERFTTMKNLFSFIPGQNNTVMTLFAGCIIAHSVLKLPFKKSICEKLTRSDVDEKPNRLFGLSVFLAGVVVFVIPALYCYLRPIAPKVIDTYTYENKVGIGQNIIDGNEVKCTFTAEISKINVIDTQLSVTDPYGYANNCVIGVSISEDKTGDIIYDERIPVNALTDKDKLRIKFKNMLKVNKGSSYTIRYYTIRAIEPYKTGTVVDFIKGSNSENVKIKTNSNVLENESIGIRVYGK